MKLRYVGDGRLPKITPQCLLSRYQSAGTSIHQCDGMIRDRMIGIPLHISDLDAMTGGGLNIDVVMAHPISYYCSQLGESLEEFVIYEGIPH